MSKLTELWEQQGQLAGSAFFFEPGFCLWLESAQKCRSAGGKMSDLDRWKDVHWKNLLHSGNLT